MLLVRGIMDIAAIVGMLHQNTTKVIGRFRHSLAAGHDERSVDKRCLRKKISYWQENSRATDN
jgi:transposase-like protein